VSAGPYRFVFDPELAGFELSPSHPFKPVRYDMARTLLLAAGALDESEVVSPRHVSDDDLLTVHDPRYVEAVKAASATASRPPDAQLQRYGLATADNPVFDRMHGLVKGVVAATVTALDLVAKGEALRAANLSGGLHHAMRDRASGFCVYNDLAVAIRRAVDKHGLRVAYVDVDAHHGDGVQWLFYDEPRVLTVSLHESGRYLFPGTGFTYETGNGRGRGAAVNLPLEPFTGDDSFLECFDAVVPRALRRFAPDVIVVQAGADMHHRDPLADLSLTLRGMSGAYERLVALADELTGGRLVLTGGGGYDAYRTVPRAWALAWAALTGRELPGELPAPWREEWEARLGMSLPRTLEDDEPEPTPRAEAIASRNRSVAERLMQQLEEIWTEASAA
jgi:acetoin utilization protein AcuC